MALIRSLTFFPSSLAIAAALGLSVISPVQARPPAIPLLAQATNAELEAGVLREVNRVRTNPKRYAIWLESLRKYYDGNILNLPGEDPLETVEGVAALDAAISDLQNRRPLLPLATSDTLAQQAQTALTSDTSAGNVSRLSHSEVPLWAVMHLVIADGQADRATRKNVLALAHRSTGVACTTNGEQCVVSYDGDRNDALVDTVAIAPIPVPDPPVTPPPTPPDGGVTPPVTPVQPPPPITPEPPPPQTAPPQIASLLNPDPRSREQGYLLLLEGSLATNDLRYEDGSFYDQHLFQAKAGQNITINLSSSEFDTFLALFDAEGSEILAQNDDIDGTSNSSVTIRLPYDGLYQIFVNGYNADDLGGYTITIEEIPE